MGPVKWEGHESFYVRIRSERVQMFVNGVCAGGRGGEVKPFPKLACSN